MNHNHAGNGHSPQSRLALAFFLNAGFAAIEFAGGVWTGSIAILADAVHDSGDALALGFAWILAKVAERQGTPIYSFGFRRLTLLGALATAIVLVVGCLGIIAEAIPRLFNPGQPIAGGMFALAILGIAVNSVAAWGLRQGHSLSERVVSWHLVEDILGWVAVLIAAIVMYFFNLPILDPLLSIGIAIFVLYNVSGKLRSTLQLFLEGVPDDVKIADVTNQLSSIAGVANVHHVHIWSLDGEKHLATAHIVVDCALDLQGIFTVRQQAHRTLVSLGIKHATIEIEVGQDRCMDKDIIAAS